MTVTSSGGGGATPVVGIVGIGAMGSAMAMHLMRGGYEVVGVDVDPARRAAFAEAGGRAATLAEVGSACDIIVTSLPSAQAARDILGPTSAWAAQGLPGRVIVETSTLSVAEKEELAKSAAVLGAELLDCPMSGTSQQAVNADLVAYISGSPEGKARAADVLAQFTRAVYDVGALGNGTRVKLVANLLVAIHNVSAAEALLLAKRVGLDLETTLAAVADGAGNSRMLEVRGPLMIDERYSPATMRVSLFRKDVRLIRELEESVGLETPLLGVVDRIYREAEEAGLGDLDTASVLTILQQSAPREGSA